jgi:hypothetical protein
MDYSNVLIRIRAPKDKDGVRYPIEAQIDRSGSWRGESEFHLDALDVRRQSMEDYGSALAGQLLNASIRRALEQAGIGQPGRRVRVRLQVDEDVSGLNNVRWERLYLPIGGKPWPIAISPEVPFSRYIAQERRDATPPDDTVFRVLLAIANPSDLEPKLQLDVPKEIELLFNEFKLQVPTARFRIRVLPGRSGLSEGLKTQITMAGWEIAEGAASLDNISKWLHRDNEYHALHVISHGNFNPALKQGILYLEKEDGTGEKVKDYELQSWIHPKLQLVVFQACKGVGVSPDGEPPYVGIAPMVVGFGVPAVVAMQDFILMEDARAFSSAFYRALMRDGFVDVAVNEGRQAMGHAAGRSDSSIPALFMRLEDGRVWRADPVRQDVANTIDQLGDGPKSLPLKAIQHLRGLDYDPAQGPEGPLFEVGARLSELVKERWLTCFTGPAGFDKTAQLQLQFLRLGKDYLEARSDTAPVWLAITELATWGRAVTAATDLRGMLQAIAARRAVPRELVGRTFAFLVQADQDITDQMSQQAIDTLLLLIERFPGSHALLIYDEMALGNLARQLTGDGNGQSRAGQAQTTGPEGRPGLAASEVAVVVVQPIAWTDLRPYLISEGEEELAAVIEQRQLTDLAATPWVLGSLRALASRGRLPTNRADALSLIASSQLVAFDTQKAPRSCAEQALEQIAWRLQFDRARALDSDTLLAIIAEVRNRRDFRFVDLYGELIRRTVLAPSGEDGVRFTYPAVQAYYAARYLQKSSRKLAYLEDITAALGRYSRVRHWEDVLVALAGLQETTHDRILLLQAIVWGSTLAEGEQVFLAGRMYMEMSTHVEADDQTLMQSAVVRQIVDTLVWRMRPDPQRSYADRRQAAERLSQIRHPQAIEHLVSLAVDRVDRHGAKPAFDNAGMRMVAVAGLLAQYEATQAFVARARPDLQPLVDAWWGMANRKFQPIVDILNKRDPSESAVAAFALAQAGMEIGGPPLLELFFTLLAGEQNDATVELTWVMAEVFGRQESRWLFDHVIAPWLAKNPSPDRRLCYVIQKYGQAPSGSGVREYLDACLRDRQMVAQDRALRALSKVSDPQTNAWLLELCYAIIANNWEAVLKSGRLGIDQPPNGKGAWRLTQASLEILRDIGNEKSIEKIRASWLLFDAELFQLAFQVAEQLYWRVTGGLAIEDFNAIAIRRPEREK